MPRFRLTKKEYEEICAGFRSGRLHGVSKAIERELIEVAHDGENYPWRVDRR